MTRRKQLRRDALLRYFVFRMKLIELFHFHLLWGGLDEEKFVPDNLMEHGGRAFADSVRTALLSWYCTIVDRTAGGLNVFDVSRGRRTCHGKFSVFSTAPREFSFISSFFFLALLLIN
jgi:hypothetical protein